MGYKLFKFYVTRGPKRNLQKREWKCYNNQEFILIVKLTNTHFSAHRPQLSDDTHVTISQSYKFNLTNAAPKYNLDTWRNLSTFTTLRSTSASVSDTSNFKEVAGQNRNPT